MSTAASLSARFPIITPVGWFKKKTKFVRLADGGYFDNSGILTALNIGNELRDTYEGSKKDFDIIYLSIINRYSKDFLPSKQDGFNEIGSPFRALFNVRDIRGKTIVKQTEISINSKLFVPQEPTEISQIKFRKILLDPQPNKSKQLPLGWLLSNNSKQQIDKQSGKVEEIRKPENCNMSLYDPKNIYREDYILNHNNCILFSINEDLKI